MTPDAEQMQRYLAGEMGPDERARFEREVLADTRLAEQLYAELNVAESVREAVAERRRRAHAGPERPGWVRWISRFAVPAVAAAALVIAAVTLFTPDESQRDPVFRGGEQMILGLEPSGVQPVAPARFRWSSDPGAARYRFELFDAESNMVTSLSTADTTLVLDSPAPPQGYWVVTPLDDNGVPGTASSLIFYRVAP